MTQVFLASRNAKKLVELRRILMAYVPGVEVLGLDDVTAYDEPAETEPSFAGNALLKARAAVVATGLPSLADDSGLCVDALNGMPGVLSARWAGTAKDDLANNRLLLEQLHDVPAERRDAHFTCAVAFAYPVGAGGVAEHVVHGEMPGRVIREMRGDGGFGYDVLFVADQEPDGKPDQEPDGKRGEEPDGKRGEEPDGKRGEEPDGKRGEEPDGKQGEERTSAELSVAEKDAMSHRGKAIREIAPLVADVLTGL